MHAATVFVPDANQESSLPLPTIANVLHPLVPERTTRRILHTWSYSIDILYTPYHVQSYGMQGLLLCCTIAHGEGCRACGRSMTRWVGYAVLSFRGAMEGRALKHSRRLKSSHPRASVRKTNLPAAPWQTSLDLLLELARPPLPSSWESAT